MNNLATIGCSFTWGQGLYFYDIKGDGELKDKHDWSASELREWITHHDVNAMDWRVFSNPKYSLMNDRHMFVKDLFRYSNLLAKELGCNLITKSENGGGNTLSWEWLQMLYNSEEPIKYLVVQLTEPLRDINTDRETTNPKWIDMMESDEPVSENIIEEFYEYYNERYLLRLWDIIREFEKRDDTKVCVFTWPREIYNFIPEDWRVEFNWKDKVFTSLEDLFEYDNTTMLSGELKELYGSKVKDNHPSRKTHDLIFTEILGKCNIVRLGKKSNEIISKGLINSLT